MTDRCRSCGRHAPPVVCSIIPSHVLAELSTGGGDGGQDAAIKTLAASSSVRGQRTVTARLLRQLDTGIAGLLPAAAGNHERQTIYDAQGETRLPGAKVRGESDDPARDAIANEAFDGAERSYSFFKDVFGRNSIDGQGVKLISSVHYGQAFDNALWNGTQMIYGDGSGAIIAQGQLTKAIDVIGHELTHGITQTTAGLEYRKQSGALNESFSDVFGSLVKQRVRGETAEQADWLIGERLLGSALKGKALRSLKDPGHAFDFDRQPAHVNDYVDLPDDNDPRNDNGGVHINSGIPNHAFYLVATTLGGNAWEKPGQIWFKTLTERLRPKSDFLEAANATVDVAGKLFGDGGLEQRAVRAAWRVVGVLR
ncbi:MAG TPA: M4 family metallopeptidase [Solirubrobacteraceae bacterium]